MIKIVSTRSHGAYALRQNEPNMNRPATPYRLLGGPSRFHTIASLANTFESSANFSSYNCEEKLLGRASEKVDWRVNKCWMKCWNEFTHSEKSLQIYFGIMSEFFLDLWLNVWIEIHRVDPAVDELLLRETKCLADIRQHGLHCDNIWVPLF